MVHKKTLFKSVLLKEKDKNICDKYKKITHTFLFTHMFSKTTLYLFFPGDSRVRVQLGPSPVNYEKNTNRLNKWFRFI